MFTPMLTATGSGVLLSGKEIGSATGSGVLLWGKEIGPGVQEADMEATPKARSVSVRELGTLSLRTCESLIAGEKLCTFPHLLFQAPLHLSKAVEARNPNSRCRQGRAPSEGSRGGSFLTLPAFGDGWLSLACKCIAVVSASCSCHCLPVSVPHFPLPIRTPVTGWGAHLNSMMISP